MSYKLGRKIIIIGNSGSGKTTLSYQLGELLNLPVIHLDKENWKEGWVATPNEEWEVRVNHLISGSEWIIDGNYAGTLELRLKRADTVIFLDYNRFVCLSGAVKRCLRYYGKTRPDMAEGCPEKIVISFLKWILWKFPTKSRRKIIKCLGDYQNGELIIIRNRKELRQFLSAIKADNKSAV